MADTLRASLNIIPVIMLFVDTYKEDIKVKVFLLITMLHVGKFLTANIKLALEYLGTLIRCLKTLLSFLIDSLE